MAALFIANGPAFRRGVDAGTFDNVDIQPLLARLIGISTSQRDGSLERLEKILEPR